MIQHDTLKLKYCHKKGFRLISIIKHHHNQHFSIQNNKALTNKLSLSTRSKHNVEKHKFGHHHQLSPGTYPIRMFTKYVIIGLLLP